MSLPDIGPPHTGAYIYLNSIFHLSPAVILYYDYALTLPREIQFLWPPHNKLGWFTLTCLLNRYLPIFGHFPSVVLYFVPGNFPLCHGLYEYRRGLVVVIQVLVATLCIIRVHALYGRSRHVLGLLLVIYLTAIINTSVILTISRRTGNETALVASSIRGCNQITTASGGLYTALAWTGVLIFDSVIFFLTLYKAFTIGKGIFLLDVIVRDGAVYFSALFIMNLVNILTLRFAPPELKNSTATLTNVISTTLVTRLVLNLREQNSVLAGLPTTVESEHKFRAALPVAGTMTPSWDITSVQVDKSTSGIAPNDVVGGSCCTSTERVPKERQSGLIDGAIIERETTSRRRDSI